MHGVAVPRLVRALRQAGRLTWVEVGEIGRAQCALLGAWWLVRTRPQGSLIGAGAERAAGVARDAGRPDELARSVDRAARYGVFRPSCLVRSIALRRVLERAGIGEAVVCVGVRWRDGRFDAHAWVELGGRPLGRDGKVAHLFAGVDDVGVVSG